MPPKDEKRQAPLGDFGEQQELAQAQALLQDPAQVAPVDNQKFHWGVSKQTDGSYVTQVAMHCMVKNRSTEPLHIMKARLIRPKIKGEVLPGLVMTRAANAAVYGTPHVSGNFIGAGQTLPV